INLESGIIMEEQRFRELSNALNEQEGIGEIFLLNSEGDVVFKSGDFQLSNDEARAILTAWKTNEPALVFQGSRFAILKNDEIQLAAKNIGGGKGNIVGSITKEGDYLVAHTRDEGLIILEWSIFINKVAWS
ncbi:MAG: hypothetical protein ACW96S_01555, partial [Promethearchaeota archaeon]